MNNEARDVKELTARRRDDIVLTAYWPSQSSDDVHIGYGFSKEYTLRQGANSCISLFFFFFSRFVAPKYRPLINPMVRTVLLLGLVPIGIAIRGRNKYTGYYSLDATGRPVAKLNARAIPEKIEGRKGLSRKHFLAQIG